MSKAEVDNNMAEKYEDDSDLAEKYEIDHMQDVGQHEVLAAEQQGLKRDLRLRHMIMIAISGTIGTGLFLTSGRTIATAGPGGACKYWCWTKNAVSCRRIMSLTNVWFFFFCKKKKN